MNKIFLIIALAMSCSAIAGEHLTSYNKVYNVQGKPHSENYTIYTIPERTDIDGWLSFHYDLFPVDGFSKLYARVSIRNTETGDIYYYGLIKPGDSHDLPFPTIVHYFHPLAVEIKCVNIYNVTLPCVGYFILYGK